MPFLWQWCFRLFLDELLRLFLGYTKKAFQLHDWACKVFLAVPYCRFLYPRELVQFDYRKEVIYHIWWINNIIQQIWNIVKTFSTIYGIIGYMHKKGAEKTVCFTKDCGI